MQFIVWTIYSYLLRYIILLLLPIPPKIWISEVFIEKNEVVICPFLERIKSKVIYVPSNSKNGVSNMESMLVRFKELKFH